MARGSALGRGVFLRGNHAETESASHVRRHGPLFSLPIFAPGMLLNRFSLRAFNALYYHRHRARRAGTMHYAPFFFPLDSVGEWNRLYGKRGFFQYQCVVPGRDDAAAVRELLTRISDRGQGSFLAVLNGLHYRI